MLTDRPDVPRTPFGRLKPPNGVFWGYIRTRLQFKRKFVRVLRFRQILLTLFKKSTRANQKFEMATIFQHGHHAIISAME